MKLKGRSDLYSHHHAKR